MTLVLAIYLSVKLDVISWVFKGYKGVDHPLSLSDPAKTILCNVQNNPLITVGRKWQNKYLEN